MQFTSVNNEMWPKLSLSVGGAVAAGVWPPAPFMISATPSAADRSTCIFATPHIAVWPVVAPFLPISPTSPRSRASTPTGYQQTAVRLVIEDDMPYRMASWHL